MPSTARTLSPSPSPSADGTRRAGLVIAAGVCAALHVGKLAPALPALRAALDMSLLQAGFALSLVQLAGVLLGLALGGLADRLGSRRSMVAGLVLLSGASALGGAVSGVTPLLLLRALEGLGFLMVVLPAPGLVRQLVPPARTAWMLGAWGSYMPLATALALLLGPLCIATLDWRAWWWLLAALTLLMAALLHVGVPAAPGSTAAHAAAGPGWGSRVRSTLAAPGPWLVALSFALYSGQWLAVVGFLPSIYAQAGVPAAAAAPLTALAAAAPLTALAAAVNMLGNLGAGRLQHRGVAPMRLLTLGFVAMGLASVAAFAQTADGNGLPPTARYAAVLLFSGLGGLIPATLFTLAVRLAPGEHTLATTVGWVQQWSSLGQMLGPPAVAALAAAVGGWRYSWTFTGACSLLGLALVPLLARQLARQQSPRQA